MRSFGADEHVLMGSEGREGDGKENTILFRNAAKSYLFGVNVKETAKYS